MPIGVFIKPYGCGGQELQLVDLLADQSKTNQKGKKTRVDIPRCSECRAYVNPFFQFMSKGTQMKCNLCGHVNSVPGFYYKGLDSEGYVNGFEECPELYSGSIEFLVNEDYSARTPKEPTYFFLIDISKSSYENNIPYYAIHAIKAALTDHRLNGNENCTFGIGFFDGNLHLLNLQSSRASLFTIWENSGFNYSLPMDKFLIYLADYDMEEIAAKLDAAYENICFSSNEATFAEISTSLKYLNQMLHKQGGKISVIVGNKQKYLPKANSKDKTNRHFFYANNNDFTKLGTDMNKNMVSIDLYLFGYKTMRNLASLADNIRLSGGSLSYYEEAGEKDLNKFFNDLLFNISKELTWEAVFRIRCSKGWKKVSYGNYYATSFNDLLRIQHVDENYSILYTFQQNSEVQGKVNDNDTFFLQTSLLYTNENR